MSDTQEPIVFKDLPTKVHCQCSCGWSEDLWIQDTGTFRRKCWRCGEAYQLNVTANLPAAAEGLATQ